MSPRDNNNFNTGIAVIVAGAVVVLGLVGAIYAFAAGPALDAWAWLLLSFLTVSSIAQGMLGWAAIFRTANARWTPVINRLGHSVAPFMVVSYLVLIALVVGAEAFLPWVKHPIKEKAAWLNLPFLRARLLVGVGLLFVLNYLLVRWSLDADARAERGEEISRQDHYRLNAVAIASVIVYTLAFTLVSWDLIMSLDPHWISTMFAPYFFMTNLYAAMGVLIVLSALLRSRLGVEKWLGAQQFQDMGNLMLGFSLFSMGLFFAQYLTIWYGNLPIETPFLILRYLKGTPTAHWPVLAWTVFIVAYMIPFIVLQPRPVKRNPRFVAPIAALGVVGVVVERYVLVVPSLQPANMWLAAAPGLMLLGFAGLLVLVMLAFLRRYGAVSAADEALPAPEMLEVLQ